MSGRPATSSQREALRSLLWRLQTPLGLTAMFGAALLVRVALAPGTGFYEDMRTFQGWAARLQDIGVGRFYTADEFADYPPGYLYVLWLITKVSATPSYLLLKLPAIVADLGVAWIAGTFAARLASESLRARCPIKALVCAAVLFNPALIALSAVWGQVDSVPALFALASLLVLYTRPPSLAYEIPAFLLFAVAIAMKPQAGLVLPVMLYALFRRHLYRRPPGEMLDGLLRILLIGVITLGLWFASALPFGLGPVSLIRFYDASASLRPFTSLNAFNFWGIIAFWRVDSAGGAAISALHVGMVLFVATTAAVLWSVHRAIERGAQEAVALMTASASVSLLAFVFLTRMHERYLILALVVLTPLVFLRPLRLAYAGLSTLLFLNLWYVYAAYNSRANIQGFKLEPWFGWLFGGFATDSWQKKLLSLMVTGIGLTVASLGSRWALAATGSPGRAPDVAPSAVAPDRPPRPAGAEAGRAAIASRFGPIALVALTCLFGLVVLRGETVQAVNLNDSAFHLQMVRWADGQISEGRVPLDGWYPYLSLGSSQFHHYQSLPHTLTAFAARATGAGDQTAYLWILYLLLALWPISVYWGARLLGWDRWSAAAAAAVSPLVVSASGYGYEHGSYTWRGYGVYSQLWGMWLLPLAWGLTWRAVTRGRDYAAAALVLALTMACHFITGYLAVLTVGVWVLVAGRGYVRRAGRAAVVVLGSMLVAAWVLVPLVGDTKWTTQSEYYTGTFFNDSYGARRVLGWLFSGGIFDSGRFPVVSLFFAAGVVLCAAQARRDVRAQALLGAFTLSLLLFFGRPTLGPVLDLLPGMHDVQIHRFVIGVHLAGILIAGVGLAWLARLTVILANRLPVTNRALVAGAAAVAAAVVVLAPAWTERADYDRGSARMIEAQVVSDETDGRDLDRLVTIVKARADGRVYAGLRSNFGATYKVGDVPVMAWLADRDVDTVGFTFRTIASLSTDVEAAFDDTNPAQYEMLGIRYVILPDGREPGVPATLVARSGAHTLWKVKSTGYLQVVDRATPVAADRTDLERALRDFMRSDAASRGIYPGVTFPGEAAAPPTFAGATLPAGSAGTVLTQSARPADGVFAGTVEANRRAAVLLKASYDPRWTATVDGLAVEPTMLAPSLVGVEVPAGRHEVEFRYRPIDDYPLLLGVGALTLLALALYPRRTSL